MTEELELKIYRFASYAGKGNWQVADLPTLCNEKVFTELTTLVDALEDLHKRGLIEYKQVGPSRKWRRYAGINPAFFRKEFQMHVTHQGQTYFERLEAQWDSSRLHLDRAKAVAGKLPGDYVHQQIE